ncbi:RING finger domain-containing protein [Endozoicomonas sp. ONNA1]|uniref:RING finger domain-containing protein n=1 Tax=unclassified Endozoicomonas TaxID=2644528 RepID=UPI0034D17010
MLYLCKSVIFTLLISCSVSYGSQDDASNHTISYEDYEKSFSKDLINLLTSLSLYYDGLRLPLRLVEIASVSFVNFHLLKPGNVFRQDFITVFSTSLIFCFYSNFTYDLVAFIKSNESLSLAFCSLVARVTEHVLSARISDYLTVKFFAGLCPICMDPIRYPVAAGACLRHFYCASCLQIWKAHSPLCPVCRQ